MHCFGRNSCNWKQGWAISTINLQVCDLKSKNQENKTIVNLKITPVVPQWEGSPGGQNYCKRLVSGLGSANRPLTFTTAHSTRTTILPHYTLTRQQNDNLKRTPPMRQRKAALRLTACWLCVSTVKGVLEEARVCFESICKIAQQFIFCFPETRDSIIANLYRGWSCKSLAGYLPRMSVPISTSS